MIGSRSHIGFAITCYIGIHVLEGRAKPVIILSWFLGSRLLPCIREMVIKLLVVTVEGRFRYFTITVITKDRIPLSLLCMGRNNISVLVSPGSSILWTRSSHLYTTERVRMAAQPIDRCPYYTAIFNLLRRLVYCSVFALCPFQLR